MEISTSKSLKLKFMHAITFEHYQIFMGYNFRSRNTG